VVTLLRYISFFILPLLFCFKVKAQFYHQPNHQLFSILTKKKLAQPDSSIHSSLEPYAPFFSDKYTYSFDTNRVFKYIKEDRALDKVFYDHLVEIKSANPSFVLRIDPLLNLETGRDTEDSVFRRLSTNTRGFIASAHIGSDFYFESTFAETQSFFPSYISNFAKASQVVPGQGRWKNFKVTGYDYAYSSGMVSYQPCKQLNIQAGHGKQKIGDGYRSLLLSDNAFNYPYLRFTQQWWGGRLQYTNIYSVLMNLDSASRRTPPNTERLFQKKPAAFQYLSLNLTKRIHVGLFQGMIWRANDRNNAPQLDWQYFNPILFTNTVFYGLNNPNNILIGSTCKVKILNTLLAYGQWMGDDLSNTTFSGGSMGYQLGVQYFDAFNIQNLFFQMEYNSVSKGAYTNPITATSNQSYSHYNQSLAYTPANGTEFLAVLDYKYKRLFFNVRAHFQNTPQNAAAISDSRTIIAPTIGYLMNPSYNLNISLGILSRTQNFSNASALNTASHYLFLGIRTSLFNTYYDF
jgi:hypothetical protein